MGFVEAYGAFDVDKAVAYLAEDADISQLMTSVGVHDVEGTVEEFRLLISWLKAVDYEQLLDSCEEQRSSRRRLAATSVARSTSTFSGPLSLGWVHSAAATSMSPSSADRSFERRRCGEPNSSRHKHGNRSPAGIHGVSRRRRSDVRR